MSEMVERVARAIEEAAMLQRVSFKAWGGSPGIPKLDMATIALAAIQAMREPTEAMLRVQMIETHLGSGAPMLHGSETRLLNADAQMYRLMIDAATDTQTA